MTHDPMCIMWSTNSIPDPLPGYDCWECDLISKVRSEYVNPNCVWGEGECVFDCPSCKRMNEMLAERATGDREGQRDMLNRCIAAVEAIENDFNSSAEWDRDYDVDPSGETRNPRIWIREAVSALNSLEVEL